MILGVTVAAPPAKTSTQFRHLAQQGGQEPRTARRPTFGWSRAGDSVSSLYGTKNRLYEPIWLHTLGHLSCFECAD
jgi:hypothetical protein